MASKGRPEKYSSSYLKKVDDYLKICIDTDKEVVVRQNSRGSKEFFHKQTVKLPTLEGFAEFAEISRKSLYNWRKSHKEFGRKLESILNVQLERLVNEGLAGNYNSTIAKLMLSSNHGMKERVDNTTDDEPTNTFNDDQIDRIAERVTRRRKSAGGTRS